MKITDLLYERLISHIRSFSNSKMKVGVELEYPIVHKQSKNIEKILSKICLKNCLKLALNAFSKLDFIETLLFANSKAGYSGRNLLFGTALYL